MLDLLKDATKHGFGGEIIIHPKIAFSYYCMPQVMLELLKKDASKHDFGGEIIPAAAKDKNVMAYLFNGYWEDIGTIKSFFDANLALTKEVREL